MAIDRRESPAPYGFVKTGKRELVPVLIEQFAKAENNNQKLVAPVQLEARLHDLADGARVPVPVMNCIDFDWKPDNGAYPKSTINTRTDTSIAVFFKPKIEEVLTDLRQLGDPKLAVIVPDSEIFDTRVFSYAQSLEEREEAARKIESGLAMRFGTVPGSDEPVMRWSRYCEVYGLDKPKDYTTKASAKIKDDPSLLSKANKQIKDSKRYLMQHGIKEEDLAGIPQDEVADRIFWYLSMYTGEGMSLLENKALMLNFEDGRVPAWYRRGADDKLPILTPANPNEFYSWRREVKAGNSPTNSIS